MQINRKKPVVTYVLVAINIIMFVVELAMGLLSNSTYVLYTLGAKEVISITAGQWWRLITPVFLHGDLQHVLFNTIALFMWGQRAEVLLGRIRYIVVYLLAGLAGSIVSYAFSPSLSIGASGAIFGIFGAFLYFRSRHKEVFNKVFGTQVLVIVAFNLFSGFTNPTIDNFGHVGGLVGGFLASGAVGLFGERKMTLPKALSAVGYVLLFAGLLVYGYLKYIPYL